MVPPPYSPNPNRYDRSDEIFRRCGRSGVLLPKVSLGFWHNFGGIDPYERSRQITHYASIMVSPTSTWQTTTVLPTGQLKRRSAD